jgi:AcrR family transcriptional regulator
VAIPDVRALLFDAAERILLRDGPNGLTSRSVTSEAGCAKGVLHRHFNDFDGFLVELVRDRVARLDADADALLRSAGTATVVGHLADALTRLFTPVALHIVGLMIFRDDLRARVRSSRPTGIPVLTEGAALLAAYLGAERDLGRIAADADVETLGLTLIGTAHLVFAGRDGTPPDPTAVRAVVSTVVGTVIRP